MSFSRPVTVAVIGAGPAGIHAAEILWRQPFETRVDLFERLPVPYGLARYGVAPDHPHGPDIIASLHTILDTGIVRLVAGVDVGTDLGLDEVRQAYDAVILAVGADTDARLDIPGAGRPGTFGAGQFVAWYTAHPDAPQSWPLDSEQVAVIGAGNVALDITRILASDPDRLRRTDMPEHVWETLAGSPVADIHVFARRGPAEAAFAPDELTKLDELPDVDIVVDPADLVLTRASEYAMARFGQRRANVEILTEWSRRTRSGRGRRVHLHFMQAPASIDGTDRVDGLTVERTEHLVNGMVTGTGEMVSYPVGQVYSAIGYEPAAIPGIGYDRAWRRHANTMGRVADESGETIPGLYVSGWAKRGPVGLIGSTKADAMQTVASLVDDLGPILGPATDPLPGLLRGRGLSRIDWDGWLRIDRAEQDHSYPHRPGRVRIVDRAEMGRIARGEQAGRGPAPTA